MRGIVGNPMITFKLGTLNVRYPENLTIFMWKAAEF